MKDLDSLRFITCGSVDDGKSTLIGRLLFDTESIFDDQIQSLQSASESRGRKTIDLSYVTDGLRRERAEGITIDVAYRYFSTPTRRFTIIDCPGHSEYTRNMVTGASQADAALILIDATKGIREQTRRHASVTSFLRIPHVIVCINKIDLLKYDAEFYHQLCREFLDYAKGLEIKSLSFIPVSALNGDNVVERSTKMNWYNGPSLLQLLESLQTNERQSSDALIVPEKAMARFNIQYIIEEGGRPHSTDSKSLMSVAGFVSQGGVTVGDNLTVLSSTSQYFVEAILLGHVGLPQAQAGSSVTLVLEAKGPTKGLRRGDRLVGSGHQLTELLSLRARICWLDCAPQFANQSLLLRSHLGDRRVVDIRAVERLNLDTQIFEAAEFLQTNDIANAEIVLNEPVYWSSDENASLGRSILIDELTNRTVAALMV